MGSLGGSLAALGLGRRRVDGPWALVGHRLPRAPEDAGGGEQAETCAELDVHELVGAGLVEDPVGDEQERDNTLAGLESSHGVLQRTLAKELRLKHTPTLQFVYDESIDRGMRITELLDE